jgi:hypothetical protein
VLPNERFLNQVALRILRKVLPQQETFTLSMPAGSLLIGYRKIGADVVGWALADLDQPNIQISFIAVPEEVTKNTSLYYPSGVKKYDLVPGLGVEIGPTTYFIFQQLPDES